MENYSKLTYDLDEIQIEKFTLEKEKNWFFDNELPFIIKEIRTCLQDCVNNLLNQSKYKSTNKIDDKETEEPNTKHQPDLDEHISFESSDGLIKGHLRIESCNIAEADFVIKSSKWNKNLPFKSTINPVNPFHLTQLGNSVNFVNITLSCMKEIEILSSSLIREVKDIFKIIQEALNNLKYAMEELLLPPSSMFPRNSSTIMDYVLLFQPNLPSDLILEFSIQNNQIFITVHCFHKLVSPSSTGTTALNLHQSSIIGQKYQLFSLFYFVNNFFLDLLDG